MKRFLFFLIILMPTVTVAQSASPKPGNTKNAVYATLQKHFKIIDSMEIDYEVKEEENKKLQQTLIRYKTDVFALNNSLLDHFFSVARSDDNKLCMLSWDTRLGGTMLDCATMALHKKSNGTIQAERLREEPYGEDDYILMLYDTIYTVITPKGALYLARGFGRGSTAIRWQEIRALTLQKDQLVPAIVFPGKESTLGVEFDLSNFRQGQEMPTIKVKNKGNTIIMPVSGDKEGFDGEYQTFVLSGNHYVEKK